MIEFFNCSYLILFFLFLFRLNLSEILIEKFLLKKKLNLLDIYSFNLLFVTFIILIISFTKISQLAVIYLLFFISIISLVIKSKNIVISKLNFDFILIFIFTFIISTELIFDPKLGWDGHFWYFKALNFFEGLNFFNLTNDRSAPHYPHLGGALWGITWKISLLNYEFLKNYIYIHLCIINFDRRK